MSEANLERAIEERITAARESKAGYSPFLNRFNHTSVEELEGRRQSDANADRMRFNREKQCHCIPLYLQKFLTPEDIRDYPVTHKVGCYLWVDPDPAESPPSYTYRQRIRDEDAERTE